METSSCDNILEILFSSPLFWKSRKVCIFLIQCHEHIHEKWDDKTKEFMDKLNKLALEWEVWPPDQTWEHSINKHDPVAFEQDECQLAENTETTEDDVIELISHFKALTTFFKKGGTSRNRPIPVDTNKFTDLLGVIRNKFAHRFLFNDSDKKLLNWFDAHAADNWIFQLQKFADYWIIRFPKLLPFTWEQYKYLDDFSSQNLADVYPNPLRKYYTDNSDNLFKAVEDFPMQLFKALKYHLQEEGCIETRFTLEGSDNQVLLEFRTLHKILVDVILDKSFSVEIAVSDESVTCEWYDLIDGSCSLTDKRNTPIKYADLPHWFRFSGYIVICNKISDIYNFANIYFKKLPEKIFSKIIIFTKADFTNLFYITEIYESYRENVVSNFINNFRLYFSGLQVTFGNTVNLAQHLVVQERKIFPFSKSLFHLSLKEDFVWDYVISNMKPEMISTLVGNLGANALTMPDLPAKVKHYVTRRFNRDNLFTFDVIDCLVQKEIMCVITNANDKCIEHFHKKPRENFLRVTDISKILSQDEINDCKIFMVRENTEKCKTAFSSLETRCKANIHFFRYLYLNRIEWIEDQRCRSSIPESISNLSCEKVTLSESEMLEQIEKTDERRVLLAGQQGWGKSQTLISIANMIRKHRPHRYVMFFPLAKFLKLVGKIEPTIDSVLMLMTDLLSKNKLEKELVRSLLRFGKTVIFEIMLDALNELISLSRRKVLLILDIITKNFMSVRLWVSTRDDLMNSLKSEFSAVVVNLDSLSENETISLLTEDLTAKFGIKKKFESEVIRFYAKSIKSVISKQLGKIPFSVLACGVISKASDIKFPSVDFDLHTFMYLNAHYPCLFDLFCDVAEISDVERDKFIETLPCFEDPPSSSILYTNEQSSPLFIITSCWFRNYKLCEFYLKNPNQENYFKHEFQHLSGKKYGLLHIVILSLTYTLPDQEIPELSQVQALLQLMVEKYPSLLEERDSQGETPFLLLLREADSIVVDCKSLLYFFITDLKADINVCDINNKTALYFKMCDIKSPLSSQVISPDIFCNRIVDRSKLLDFYIGLWEILYEKGLRRNINQSSSDSLNELPFSSVEILGVSRNHNICFYKLRGPENTDVFISDNIDE